MSAQSSAPLGPLKWGFHDVRGAGLCKDHSATLIGGGVYVFGGHNVENGTYHHDLFVISRTETGYEHTRLAGTTGELPEQRSGHRACLVHDRLFIVGGRVGSVEYASNLVYIFDLTLREWSLPRTYGKTHPRLDRHVMHYIHALNVILCFGGVSGQAYGNCVTCLKADSLTWEKWNPVGTAPQPRANASSCLVGSTCYIFGGRNNAVMFGDLHLLEMPNFGRNAKWSSPDIIGHPRRRIGGAQVYWHGYVVLFGGHTEGGGLADLRMFDVRKQTWVPVRQQYARGTTDSMIYVDDVDWSVHRMGHTITVMPDGVLLLLGGYGNQAGIVSAVSTLLLA